MRSVKLWDVGKTWPQRRCRFNKGKSVVENDPRKVGVGLTWRQEPSRRRLGWRLAWWGSTEKKESSHLIRLRGRHQYLDQYSNRIRARCVASTAVGTEG